MSIFNVVGTPYQVTMLSEAINRCKFDFGQLLAGLKNQTGKSQIGVSFARLGAGVGGWASSNGSIQISSDLSQDNAESVFLMEAGHAVDFFWLTDSQRKAIMTLFHPDGPDSHQWFGSTSYFNQVGEAWTTLFTWATSDLRPDASNYTHGTNEALADKLRVILGMSPVPPQPPTPPTPPTPSYQIALIGSIHGTDYHFNGVAKSVSSSTDLAVSLTGTLPAGGIFGHGHTLSLSGSAKVIT